MAEIMQLLLSIAISTGAICNAAEWVAKAWRSRGQACIIALCNGWCNRKSWHVNPDFIFFDGIYPVLLRGNGEQNIFFARRQDKPVFAVAAGRC